MWWLDKGLQSRWISGFCRGLRKIHNVEAELWGLLEGLRLATSLNITKLNIQIDATYVGELINDISLANVLLNPLLCKCKNLLAKIPCKIVSHIFREQN